MRLTSKLHSWQFAGLYGPFLLVLAALPSSPGTGLDPSTCSVYLAVAVSALAVHLVGQRSDNWLRPDIIFLVGFFVVNYQWLTMALVSGIFPERTSFLFAMDANATYGAWLSTISLVFWFIGYAIANPSHRLRIDRVAQNHAVLVVSILTLAAFIVFSKPGYFTAELYRTLQVNIFQTVTGFSAYLLTIVEILTFILVSMFFYPRIVDRKSLPQRSLNRISSPGFEGAPKLALLLYFAIYSLAFLMAAERGQIIQLLSAVGVVYAMNFRPVRFGEFAVLLALSALVFTGIGVARSIDGGLSVVSIFGDDGYWALTRSLANSAITLYQGIDIVHTGHGFFFGQLWLSQILGLVPFLQSLFLAVSGFELEDVNSATNITIYILGPNPHTGFGTSFVIDIYMNFGVPGVVFLSFMYGYICRFVSTWIIATSGFLKFFVAVVFVSLIFYVSRSSLLIQLRPVVWGLMIIILFVSIKRQRP